MAESPEPLCRACRQPAVWTKQYEDELCLLCALLVYEAELEAAKEGSFAPTDPTDPSDRRHRRDNHRTRTRSDTAAALEGAADRDDQHDEQNDQEHGP